MKTKSRKGNYRQSNKLSENQEIVKMEQEVNNIIEQKNLEMDEEVVAIENENVE